MKFKKNNWLSIGEANILYTIEDGMYPHHVYKITGITYSHVCRCLVKMEQLKLLTYKEKNGREKIIKLSTKGKRIKKNIERLMTLLKSEP